MDQKSEKKPVSKVGEVSHNPPEIFDASLRSQKRVGLSLLILVFGGFGGWATLAPIEGAAVAPGTVTVRSYSKFIQHLEGGIIDEITVEDGAEVEQGEPILVLDSTQPKAQLDIANSQLIAMRALEMRLIAERDGLNTVNFPASFGESGESAPEEKSAQKEIFNARKATREGRVDVLEQRIEQLQTQIVGVNALKLSKEKLAESFSEELVDVEELLKDGFSEKTRLRELERNIANLEGEAGDLSANIAGTEMRIGETRLEILQIQTEFLNEVVTELSQVQTNINDVTERIVALSDIVARTTIRAPESGIVNGLQIHTIGGVITPGMPILEIVPQKDDLIIEAQVSLNDIDRVAINQNATIRFSSFGSATVPTIYGKLINLSANRIVDEITGLPYYLARVEVTPEGIDELGDLILLPGMPAEVFISTGSRTMLEYLFKPFSNAMARSFRED